VAFLRRGGEGEREGILRFPPSPEVKVAAAAERRMMALLPLLFFAT